MLLRLLIHMLLLLLMMLLLFVATAVATHIDVGAFNADVAFANDSVDAIAIVVDYVVGIIDASNAYANVDGVIHVDIFGACEVVTVDVAKVTAGAASLQRLSGVRWGGGCYCCR